MPDAPLGQEQLIEIGRALLMGSSGVFALALLAGAGTYIALCMRSSREWDGTDRRWRLPRR